MIDDTPAASTNRSAILSLIAALLTLLSVCIAVAPIPFTGYVCYPAAALLGMVALGTGIAGLAQIKARNENGRMYALIGIWVGALALLASACAISLGILLFPKFLAFVHAAVQWLQSVGRSVVQFFFPISR